MIRGRTVGIVIPCHNEERGLAAMLPRRPAEVDEVVVVDNNSGDRTAEVARAHGARVVFEPVPGYGQAYQAGFAAAQAEILVSLDGDGQYPMEDVPRLVEVFLERDLDFLSGCRFPLEETSMTFTRKLGNVLLTAAARLLFGVRMIDTQSGMWVFRRSLLNVVHPAERGMPFSEEFKLRVVRAGLRFGEEHIAYHQREGMSTLRPLRDGWENIRFLLRFRFASHPSRAPSQSAPAAVRERIVEHADPPSQGARS